MTEKMGMTKNDIVAHLVRSEHGELKKYIPIGTIAAKEHPDFFAHLVVWDMVKGQIRDSKVALPVLALTAQDLHPEFVENALALIGLLGPREMIKAYRFVLEVRPKGRMTAIRNVMIGRILENEKNWPKWERTMLQHKTVLRELFALLHISPADERTDACLFRRKQKRTLVYPEGGLFEAVANLKNMSPQEAAGTILTRKIPFMVIKDLMGDKVKDTDFVLALIKSMTATELVTSTKMLENWGMKSNSALRGAYQEALTKAGSSTANVLKASRAAEAIEDDELSEKLHGLQEKQIKKFSTVEGRWLILADRSPSMEKSVEVAKEVAGILTSMTKEKVALIFFDSMPQTIDVTGQSLDQIKALTMHIKAGGSGTSIGCGLMRMLDKKEEFDGIAIVSDGEENSAPYFPETYKQYSKMIGREIPVYFYETAGGLPRLKNSMANEKLDMQCFDLRSKKVDFYSLPNLVQTMRTNRYSLIDEIMETRLLKLSDALKMPSKRSAAKAS